MFRWIITPILLLQLAGVVLTAQPTISNVHVEMRAETKLVDIHYDLQIFGGNSATITVRVSPDSGESFLDLPPSSLSGAIGASQQPASGKHIVWNPLEAGWKVAYYPQVVVEVSAALSDHPPAGFA